MDTTFKILRIGGTKVEEHFLYEKQTKSFGRHTENDIVCLNRSVSRFHCVFHVENNKVTVKDLKSGNGVYVNGRALIPERACEIYLDDFIGMGTNSISDVTSDDIVYQLKLHNNNMKREAEKTTEGTSKKIKTETTEIIELSDSDDEENNVSLLHKISNGQTLKSDKPLINGPSTSGLNNNSMENVDENDNPKPIDQSSNDKLQEVDKFNNSKMSNSNNNINKINSATKVINIEHNSVIDGSNINQVQQNSTETVNKNTSLTSVRIKPEPMELNEIDIIDVQKIEVDSSSGDNNEEYHEGQYSQVDCITISDDESDVISPKRLFDDLSLLMPCQNVKKENADDERDVDLDALTNFYEEKIVEDTSDEDETTLDWLLKLSQSKLQHSEDKTASVDLSEQMIDVEASPELFVSNSDDEAESNQGKKRIKNQKKVFDRMVEDSDASPELFTAIDTDDVDKSKQSKRKKKEKRKVKEKRDKNKDKSKPSHKNVHIDHNKSIRTKCGNEEEKRNDKEKNNNQNKNRKKLSSISEDDTEEPSNSSNDLNFEDTLIKLNEPSISTLKKDSSNEQLRRKVILTDPHCIQKRRSSIPSYNKESVFKPNQKSSNVDNIFTFDKVKPVEKKRNSGDEKDEKLRRVQEKFSDPSAVIAARSISIQRAKKEEIKHDRAERLRKLAEANKTDKSENRQRLNKPKTKVTWNNRGSFLVPQDNNNENDKINQPNNQVPSKSSNHSNKPETSKSISKPSNSDTSPDQNGSIHNYDPEVIDRILDNLNEEDMGISDMEIDDDPTENDNNFNNIDVDAINIRASYLNDLTSKKSSDDKDDISVCIQKAIDTIKIPKKLPPILKSKEDIVGNDDKKVKKRITFCEDIAVYREFDIDEGNSMLKKCVAKDAMLPKKYANSLVTTGVTPKLDAFLSTILQWSPLWLREQKNNRNPPPLFPSNFHFLPIMKSYKSYEEYYHRLSPLMALEIWAGITHDAEDPAQTKKQQIVGSIVTNSITKHTIDNNHNLTGFLIESLVNSNEKHNYPSLGDLLIIDIPYNSMENTQRRKISIFCYVHYVTSRPLGPKTHYNRELKHCYPDADILLTYEMRTGIFERFLSIPTEKIFKIKYISYLRSNLRMVQAIQYLPFSPLIGQILQPNIDDYKLPSVSVLNYKLKSGDNLNPKQIESVARITNAVVSKDSNISLIQGPPGTGKSRVIVNLVTQILYNNSKSNKHIEKTRILVCAPSNAAIDEIGIRLLNIRKQFDKTKRFKMVRIGNTNAINSIIQEITLSKLSKREQEKLLREWNLSISDGSVDEDKNFILGRKHALQTEIEWSTQKGEEHKLMAKNAELEQYQLKFDYLTDYFTKPENRNVYEAKLLKNVERTFLIGADIIICTLSSCYTNLMESLFGNKKMKISVCIVDEATQATEAETLIPLMLGVKNLVLVGDHKQLPATVLDKRAKSLGFDQSLFARLHSCFADSRDNPVIQLDTQYRMAHPISQWPNKYFYNNILKNNAIMRSLPYEFYKILNLESVQNIDNFSNNNEAAFVANIVYVMMTEAPLHYIPNIVKIGIITPYKSQRVLIISELNRRLEQIPPEVKQKFTQEVNTIDSYQGQERDVIIMSCVRSSGIGFMNDRQRLCVALTRAKHSLFLCGNFKAFEGCEMWNALLTDARSRKVFCNVNYNADSAQLKRIIFNNMRSKC